MAAKRKPPLCGGGRSLHCRAIELPLFDAAAWLSRACGGHGGDGCGAALGSIGGGHQTRRIIPAHFLCPVGLGKNTVKNQPFILPEKQDSPIAPTFTSPGAGDPFLEYSPVKKMIFNS